MTSYHQLENVADVYVLSPMQQGILFHTISDPGTGMFVNQMSIRLDQELDPVRFRQAWDELIGRHDVLRTAFLWDGLDEPLQVVRETVTLPWHEEDWSAMTLESQEAALAEFLHADRGEGFDLAHAPLCRMALFHLGEHSWRWVWTSHHIVADGWSAQILLDELRSVYLAGSVAQADLGPAFRFRDFIAWQGDQQPREAFWRSKLSGYTEPYRLAVPGIAPRPDVSTPGIHELPLDAAATASLKAMAATHRVTLNTTVVAAWALVLSQWARSNDVVFGVTTSGRPQEMAGVNEAVGLFISTLPLRISLEPDMNLVDWLKSVQDELLDLQEQEATSLADIQRWSQVTPGEPLFESVLVFENYPKPDGIAEVLPFGDRTSIEQGNYPLAILGVPGATLRLIYLYDPTRLDHEAVESLADQMRLALLQFAEAPELQLGDLRLIDSSNASTLQGLGQGPELDSDLAPVLELIEEMAKSAPGRVAISFKGQRVTYGQLESRSSNLASRLVELGVAPNSLVGLHADRSPHLIVGMLGILKAGGAYVPLDPAYPPSHIRGIMDQEDIGFVVSNADSLPEVPEGCRTEPIDEPQEGTVNSGVLPIISPEDLAYVIHTSGSAGISKGVMVTHRNLAASTVARISHYGGPVDRFLLLSSFAFDSSVAGIFWTLCTGGTLVLPPSGLEQDLDGLGKLIAGERVTHLLALPALYELLLEEVSGHLVSLRVAIVAGETCPASLADKHLQALSDTALYNEYGPTEATVWSTVHRLSESDIPGPVPIGLPIPGAQVKVVDAWGRTTPLGFPGELWIGGPGIARGYLGRADLTKSAFVGSRAGTGAPMWYRSGDLVAYRSDGQLLFLGRADKQVKVRGHRIEIESVEASLRAIPGIKGAVVTVDGASGRSGAQLVGYLATNADAPIEPDAVKEELGRHLPGFMVPDRLVALDSIPRLPNGKLDRDAIRLIAEERASQPSFVAPRDSVEQTLADIWSSLLDVERVGIHDDYFSLGGDSIISIQMVSRARQAGIRLEPGQVARYPTIAQLAVLARETGVTSSPDDDPVVGDVSLGPVQNWFFHLELEAPDHWNMTEVIEFPDGVDIEALRGAVDACVNRHDMLRARYTLDDGSWRQTVEPPGSGFLEVARLPAAQGIEPLIAETNASLYLVDGPQFRIKLILRDDRPPTLVWAVHHLVVDVVSWSILLDDLDMAYRQALEGRSIDLGDRTASFAEWVDTLDRSEREDELPFWRGQSKGSQGCPLTTSTEGESTTLVFELEVELSSSLLGEANDAFGTRPLELLVTALARSLVDQFGSEAARLWLEGHGRSHRGGPDVSRTVGWFTADYPIAFDLPEEDDDVAAIKVVKETLRTIPDEGVGYGVLRYLDDEPSLSSGEGPWLLFNYVGRAAQHDAGSFKVVATATTTSRADDNALTHPLEIVGSVRSGRLVFDWRFASGDDNQLVVEELAAGFLQNLSRLVMLCLEPGARSFTPSDFPESGLDQRELDEFLESLG